MPKVLVIGEYPSVTDEKRGELFSDAAGAELRKMLSEAGFDLVDCAFTSVLPERPFNTDLATVWTTVKKEAVEGGFGHSVVSGAFCHPSVLVSCAHLNNEIDKIKPNVIIGLGNLSLWALTGETSVNDFRGSLERTLGSETKVIATYSPEQIFKMWEWRWLAVRDMKRAFVESHSPDFPVDNLQLLFRPTYTQVLERLNWIIGKLTSASEPVVLSPDIETISRHIACIGIAWSPTEAICIPFMNSHETHYFSADEEFEIIIRLDYILCHPNAFIVGQNWSYDTQHIVRSWLFRPRADADTMLAQHALFPGTKKDLAMLASLYCDNYTYWKDELTDYRTLPEDLDGFWKYNAKDCCYTYQVHLGQQVVLRQFALDPQRDFLNRLNRHVITMMIRGVAIDREEKTSLMLALQPEIEKRKELINYLAGQELNIGSPKQMSEFFYGAMKMKQVRNRKTFRPTTDSSALQLFGQREPILKPLCDLIEETRSIGVFLSTFVMMPLDIDQRMRCNFNVGGTETFRFSSSKNAFGSGGNLQNIPKGSEDEELDEGVFRFPNLRKMFIPDPGFFLFDVDLAGADAQVVAWEAEDDDLKAKFRSGQKIHALNAKDIYGRDAGPDGKRAPYYKMAKMGCHLCLADGHEVLTPLGWQRVESVSNDTPIVVCNLDGTEAHMHIPSAWYHAEDSLEMLEIVGQAYHQLVTPNHKLPYAVDTKGVNKWTEAQLLPKSARLPKSSQYSGTVHIDPNWLRLLSAFHADGTISKLQVIFHFKKERKIARLFEILDSLGISPKVVNTPAGTVRITLCAVDARWLIEKGKCPTWTMLQWSRECLQAYVGELPYWDGHISATAISFSTVVPQTAEIIHTLLHLCGKSGNTYPHGDIGGITVQIGNRPLHRVASGQVRRVQYTGGVHCPTVSTGFFLTRYKGKIAVTGNTNYGGGPGTLSSACGMTMKEAEAFQKRWFDLHPGIKTWHDEVMNSLNTTRTVSNKFGFRRRYFERLERLLPEALAWIPQSTVALIINNALCAISESEPLQNLGTELLLQVHDSLVGQIPKPHKHLTIPLLRKALMVTVPYSDPLVIGTSLDVSEQSWGDLISLKWEDISAE